jgi:hypothetical protein
MALLRRRTSSLLLHASLACAVVTLAFAIVAWSGRPETRIPTLLGWCLAGACVVAFAGEGVSRANVIFAALFSLPIVSTVVATYEVHMRWGVSMSWGLLALVVVLALHGAIFLRALIAAGGADYPYDD